jgi:ribosomal protein S30
VSWTAFKAHIKKKKIQATVIYSTTTTKKIEKESKQAEEGVIFSTTRNKHPRNKTKRKGSQTSRSRNINKYKISVGLALAKSNASNSWVLPLLLSMTSTFCFVCVALCDFFLRSIVHLAYLFYLFIYLFMYLDGVFLLFIYVLVQRLHWNGLLKVLIFFLIFISFNCNFIEERKSMSSQLSIIKGTKQLLKHNAL